MSKSDMVRRQVASFAWAAGASPTVDIPRGPDLQSVYVEIVGTIQRTTGATAVSALAPAQLVNNFTLGSDGSRQFENITGRMAAWANFERGLSRDITAPGIGVATDNVYVGYHLDRCTMDALRPKDSALHTSRVYMSSLPLVINMGQLNDLYATPGPVVYGAIALICNVYVEQIREFSLNNALEPKWLRRTVLYDQVIAGANSLLQVPLPLGSFYRGSKILQMASATNEPAQLINSFNLRNGSDIRYQKVTPAAQRSRNRNDYRLAGLIDTVPGMFFVDTMTVDGSIKEIMDLRGATDAWLEFDVQANTRLQICHVSYDPVKAGPGYQAAKAA